MPQDLRDVRQRRATANHVRRQAVAEQVSSTAAGPLYLRVREPATDDVANDGRPTQADVGREGAHEHASSGAHPMILAEVVRQRLADIGEQRQVLDHATFAANDQLTRPPTNVLELQTHHLPRAQSESREQ